MPSSRARTDEFRARLRDDVGELLTPIELRTVAEGEEEETELVGGDPPAIPRSASSSARMSASRSMPP